MAFGNRPTRRARSLAERAVRHGRDSELRHVTNVFVARFLLQHFSQCHETRNRRDSPGLNRDLQPETLYPTRPPKRHRPGTDSPPRQRGKVPVPGGMADGERSPLLSEQHDGTNGGFSPGGGKPQSTSVTFGSHVRDTCPDYLQNCIDYFNYIT